MQSRRLDDHIRNLCARIVAASDAESEQLVKELRTALAEKTGRLRSMTVNELVYRYDRDERRSQLKREKVDSLEGDG